MSTDAFDLTAETGFSTPGRRKNKWDATVAPTSTDDAASLYEVGSVWVDTTTDTAYICVGSTAAAAVWDEIGGGAGGSLGWFDVTDYGATGDGVTDDTTAIDSAIVAYNAAGGVLYFPQGTYRITAALTTLTKAGRVIGDGGETDSPATEIQQESTTAAVFTATSGGVEFRSLRLYNTSAGATTSDGIVCSTGDHYRFTDVAVRSFRYGVDIDDGEQWRMNRCHLIRCLTAGVRVRNTVDPDAGDWHVTQCFIQVETNATGISIGSSGGGQVFANKFNGENRAGTQAIVVDMSSGATGVLLIEGNSIENIVGDVIEVVPTGGATWSDVHIVGNQFGLGGNTANRAVEMIAVSSGDIKEVIVVGNVFRANSNSGAAIALTNVEDGYIDANVYRNWATDVSLTTCTNVTEGGSGTPATTVTDETTFGITPAVGTDAECARQDHTHGSPDADAIKAEGRWEPVQWDDGTSPWPFVYLGDEIVVAFVET